ncbi:regulatory protein RecX [uncultured Psychroserpens sp.]|uniref:regulatory protein RecX n=1 Tax=uncultured Psychroserpens sp. TaxID=255436 RepID=UPI0026369295|nr:regulatory protein RecX [uncultured Psychroserpens sp.]
MIPRKTYTVDEARKRMERYCVYQERCHKEVHQKLYEMRMIPEARDQIVVHLIKHNFLNEERYAKAFVNGKFRIKKWGRQRLKLELKRKDISKINIATALKEIRDEEYHKTLDAIAEKRLIVIKESNRQKKRKKLADFLLYRGWESSLVYEKVKDLIP